MLNSKPTLGSVARVANLDVIYGHPEFQEHLITDITLAEMIVSLFCYVVLILY